MSDYVRINPPYLDSWTMRDEFAAKALEHAAMKRITASNRVYAKCVAETAYEIAERGRKGPRSNEGWWRESRWPPNAQEEAA